MYAACFDFQNGLCSICHLPGDAEGLGGRYSLEHDDYLEICHWRCNPANPQSKTPPTPHVLDTVEEPPIAGEFLAVFETCKRGTTPVSYYKKKNYYKKTKKA